MPAIGAEVADAYIEVHADTGPFRRELRREATLAAQDASDDFGVQFTKAIDKDLDPLGVKVARQLREMGELGGDNLIEGIADQVRARADRINKAFAQSITFGDFAPFIESFNNFDDAIEDFSKRLRALNKDGTLTDKTFSRLDASFNAYIQTIQNDAIAQALDDQRRASVAALDAEEKRIDRQTKINDIFARDFEKDVSRLTAAQERLTDALGEVDRESPAFKAVAKDLKGLEKGLAKAEREARLFNLGLGSLKGSRNNFLNFIGTLSGFLERNIGSGLRSMFEGIGSGVSFLGKSLSDVNGPLGAVGRGLNSFGTSINKLGSGGLDGLLVQAAALIIGLQLLIAVLGPLAAGVSGLAAAFTALAIGIGGGLLGGIVALGPALSALALGASAVAIGFTNLDKAQKAVFAPLTTLFNEVRRSIQERLFDGLGGQVGGLVTALTPLGPFLTNLAGVFADWVADVVGEIGPDGPLAATFASLGEDLPGIFRTLLDLVSAVGGSLTGLFAGAAPGAQRLFEGITGVVEQFSAWVNTAAGQQAINEFMQQAVDILTTLWDIAQQAGIALGELWQNGGQEAAQTLLTTIQNLVTEFATWLGDVGNRQALIDFFNNGVRVAGVFGTIIGALLRLFDSLDTQFTRAGFLVLAGHVVAAIEAFRNFTTWTQNILQAIGQFGARAIAVANQVGSLGTRASQAGQTFRTTLGNAFTAVGNFIKTLVTRFLSLRNPMEIAASSGRALRAQLIAAFTAIGASISGFVRTAAVRLQAFLLSARNVFNGVVQVLRNLASSALSALVSFANAINTGVQRGLSFLRSFASSAVSAISGLASRFVSMGADIIGGLYNGIVGAAGRVLSYISGLAGQVAATFASVLGMNSPSKVFRVLGGYTVQGFIIGMQREERAANKEAGDLAEGVIKSAITSLEQAQSSIRRTANQVSEALASAGGNPRVDKVFHQLGARMVRQLTNGLDDGRDAAAADVKKIIETIGKVAANAMKGEDARTRGVIERQAAALRQWVQGQGAALDAVWRQVDLAGERIEAARDRLADLQREFTQMRESVRDSLSGELDLSAGIQDDGTATFESVASQVSGLASRMKKFAGLIKRLIKAGFPPALVQEVAALGSTEGIAVANALLSGTKAQQQQLIADFGSVQQSADAVGLALAEQMYRTGIEAQKGLIRGLEKNREQLIAAAKRIAKTITDEIKKELGIRSPSRVFEEIGGFITEGLALGIERGAGRVNSAVNGLVDNGGLNNLNSPLSALASQTVAASGGAAVGGIEAGAITVVTPFANPRLVAVEVMDELAKRGK